MDIDIVNRILRLCSDEQRCLFEFSFLWNTCREEKICSNSKYILASIKNYLEIFKISRDQNRIELFMPFEICRNNLCSDENRTCSNLHVCYDYFYLNSCRRGVHCPLGHVLNEKSHGNILGSLVNLDLDLLTKAFRVYCPLNKHLVNHCPSKMNGHSSTWKISTPQIDRNSSWKINQQHRSTISKPKLLSLFEKGVEICWKPNKDIQTHFIEVIFSNQIKSNGGPMQTHQIYQHLGVAQVFYQNSDIADQVVKHGSVTFQSFTFIPRLLHRTIDMRHICLRNLPIDSNEIEFYIDTISKPYEKDHFEYYQNDLQIIIVEYKEDIDFSRIYSNVRNNPECNEQIIQCLPLYLPQVLLVEHEENLSENNIRDLFDQKHLFHIKTHSCCSFVHFYSHHELQNVVNQNANNSIRMMPIYIEIYSQNHLKTYLERRETELTLKSLSAQVPILPPPPIDQQTESIQIIPSDKLPVEDRKLDISSDSDGDDFHDLPSDFDDNDLFLDENLNDSGDMEFLRNAAKNLMTSLNEMEEASSDTETGDAPHSLLYGDDYVITITSRRFALAFLDYTQFRVEKQRNPDRFRLLTSLKKLKDTKKRVENVSLPTNETSNLKKKRNKRNKKKKSTNTKDDEDQLSS